DHSFDCIADVARHLSRPVSHIACVNSVVEEGDERPITHHYDSSLGRRFLLSPVEDVLDTGESSAVGCVTSTRSLDSTNGSPARYDRRYSTRRERGHRAPDGAGLTGAISNAAMPATVVRHGGEGNRGTVVDEPRPP